MAEDKASKITRILQSISNGDRSAVDRLMPLVYDDLRSIASRLLSRERPGHSFQPTELVNEAYMKLVDQKHVDWQGRTHFYAIGAQAMRRILTDHARSKLRLKRGQRPHRVEWSDNFALSIDNLEDVLALDEAMTKLEKLDRRQALIVELRFFGGLTVQEVAEYLGVSRRTVELDWTMVKAWLRRELSAPPS